MSEYERCSVCGRVAADVSYDYIGPDPNDVDGEYWNYVCGLDVGCDTPSDEAGDRTAAA